jgi:hypothetical protein
VRPIKDEEVGIGNCRELQQRNQQIFIQIRTKFLAYALEKGFFKESDRNNPDLTLSHHDVIEFLRLYLKEFRPLTDLIISQMNTIVFRIRQLKHPEESEKKEQLNPKHQASLRSQNNDEEEEEKEKMKEENPNEALDETPQVTKYEVEGDDDSEINDPNHLKKRYIFRNICLQLHSNNLQISKTLHKFFDPEKKGYCTMSKCIFVLLNYYKLVMLPEDIKLILNDFLVENQTLNETNDLLDFDDEPINSNLEDSVLRVDYLMFLQEVARPYIYEVSKKELFMGYQNFMKLLFGSIVKLSKINFKDLEQYYLSKNEKEI